MNSPRFSIWACDCDRIIRLLRHPKTTQLGLKQRSGGYFIGRTQLPCQKTFLKSRGLLCTRFARNASDSSKKKMEETEDPSPGRGQCFCKSQDMLKWHVNITKQVTDMEMSENRKELDNLPNLQIVLSCMFWALIVSKIQQLVRT